MKKYYLKVRGAENNTASLKAKLDIEQILSKEGYDNLYDTESKGRKINLLIAASRLMFESDAVIVTQYPFITPGERSVLNKVRKYNKNIKLVSIIHDVNSLRDLGHNTLDKIEEIKFMNENDCIISHNEYMTKWFKNNGVTTKIVNIEIFDYLSEHIEKNTYMSNFKSVYFAGNLDENKSKFIYLDEIKKLGFTFKLYGPNFNVKSNTKNLIYEGCFSPEELVYKFESGFGLIWDGTSIDECDGINGEYLKYNNPHKTSLYLSSGLPVIIWSKAAMADFICKNKVGVKVNSLTEIENILKNMTLEEYKLLKKNAEKLQQQLLNGEFTINAINKSIQMLKEE